MSITQYNINSYSRGVNGYGLPFTNTSYSVTLPRNVDTTLEVPGLQAGGAPSATYAKMYAVIKYSTDNVTWVASNDVAAFPAGAAFLPCKGELSPECKYVRAGDVLHFFTDTANIHVNVAFFAVQD